MGDDEARARPWWRCRVPQIQIHQRQGEWVTFGLVQQLRCACAIRYRPGSPIAGSEGTACSKFYINKLLFCDISVRTSRILSAYTSKASMCTFVLHL